jgi:hypothetical protein
VKLAIFNDDRQADTDRFARRFADEQVLPAPSSPSRPRDGERHRQRHRI